MVLVSLLDPSRSTAAHFGEAEVRRRINTAVIRALAEPEFAAKMLANPVAVMDGAGCTPQQYLKLSSIRAGTVRDFAQQAYTLFFPSLPASATVASSPRAVTAL